MLLTPYRPVLRQPVLRRALPGLAVSALGDGMSIVAIAWLALQIAPPGARGAWVGAAVAAYSLPSALGGVLLRRYLGHRPGAQLTGWNALLRGGALAAVVAVYAAGGLRPWLYVALLAASSLLAAWGSAGRYTMVAEFLPAEHHLAANGVLSAIGEFATIVGPPLAGLLIDRAGAAVVLGLDAASFAVLAATVPWRARAAPKPAERADAGGGPQRRLLALTFGFALLFGPFYAAMPIHVSDDLHAGAGLLGAYYTGFGVGALAGALGAAHLRRLPLWPAMTGLIVLFGLAMLPLALGWPAAVALPAFAVAGLCWSPYLSTVMALFQRTTPAQRLPRVLAAFGAVTVVAAPIGTAAGGFLVEGIGAAGTLLASALGMVALGACAMISGGKPKG